MVVSTTKHHHLLRLHLSALIIDFTGLWPGLDISTKHQPNAVKACMWLLHLLHSTAKKINKKKSTEWLVHVGVQQLQWQEDKTFISNPVCGFSVLVVL